MAQHAQQTSFDLLRFLATSTAELICMAAADSGPLQWIVVKVVHVCGSWWRLALEHALLGVLSVITEPLLLRRQEKAVWLD